MAAHIVGKKTYFGIFGALMVLTAVTVWVANFDLGRWNAVAALTIAVVKGTLVVLYFMHVRYSSRLTWVFVSSGLIWLIVLIALTLGDYMTRGWVKIAQ